MTDLLNPDNCRTLVFYEKRPATVLELIKATGFPVTSAYRYTKRLSDAGLLIVVDKVADKGGYMMPVYASNFSKVTYRITKTPRRRTRIIELKDGTILEEGFTL